MKAFVTNDKVLRVAIVASTLIPSFARADCDSDPTECANPLQAGSNAAKSKSNTNSLFGSGGTFKVIADTLIYIVGAVAVIMLIIGGLRYVISQGNEKGVAAAKDTILYSVIGIVVAILAFAIVNFVSTSLAPTGS